MSLSLLPIGAAACFISLVGWLHVRRTDIDARTQGISHYAVGSTHAVMTAAFVSLSVGLGATAHALSRSAIERSVTIGSYLVALASVAIGAVALVPVPPRDQTGWRGPVHSGSALIFFISIASGAAIASRPLSNVVAIARLLAFGVLVFLASMGGVPGLFPLRGWLQRACFILVALWVMLVGTHFVANGPPV